MQKILVVTLLMMSMLSCSQPPKVKDADEFGKKIFDLFKEGKKETIVNYLITKGEVKKVFSDNKEYNDLNEVEKNELVNASYDRMRNDAMTFIEFYTDKKSKESALLQKGIFEKVSSHGKNDNGPPAIRIEVVFMSDGQKYYLNLDASKIDDYWKLLSWIELKKSFR